MPGLRQLDRKRAVDEVYQIIRDAILNRLFKPGERLAVHDLARKLGVSVTPVRGALELLATQGLVEIRPRSGTYVAHFSPRDIEETFDVRCALECYAAELAVERLTDEDIARMRELARKMAVPVSTKEGQQEHERDNAEFHRLLILAARNRKLLHLYEQLQVPIQIARVHAQEAGWIQRLGEEQKEHELIVEAAAARDLKQLQDALRQHLMRAKRDLVRALQRLGE